MNKATFVICIDNSGFPASLERRKIYESLADPDAEKHGQVRVIDESGEDYLYPSELFVEAKLPEDIRAAVARYFQRGSKAGIQAAHASKLRLILARLHASVSPKDMDLPGLYLHQLKGSDRGVWSVRVSGNWRITFRFEGPDAVDVNYEDYH